MTAEKTSTLICILCIFASLASAAPAPELPQQPADRGSAGPIDRVRFRDAITRALQRNPSALVATLEVRRAEALVEQVRAASLPTITANMSYARLDNNRCVGGASDCTGTSVLTPKDAFGANLILSVPIIAPQRWATWSHSRDNVDVARWSAAEARRQVAISAARTYLSLLSQHRTLEITTRARVNAKAHLDFAEARLQGGVGNRLDEARAAQEFATDQAQEKVVATALVRLEESLGVLLGMERPVDVAEEPALDGGPGRGDDDREAVLATAAKRTDVELGRTRAEAARRVLRDSWTDYMPYLVGTFEPFYQNPPSLTVPSVGWQAQFLFTLPLYDGGLRYGQRRERAALHKEALVNLEGTLRQARSDVRTAVRAVELADEALRAAQEAARRAQEAQKLANIAYRAGATTSLDLIDAERQARDVETAAENAADTARQARLDLLIATSRFP